MSKYVLMPLAAVTAIHDRQITRHGGAPGLRDHALLGIGCARAMTLAAYGSVGLSEIAAAYAFGIVKAHAHIDGNKRTAFVAAITFLRLNGHAFRPDPVEGLHMMVNLAPGDVTEPDFASWLEQGTTAI